jgi:hypothetical protein
VKWQIENLNDTLLSSLNPEEIAYFEEYTQLLSEYFESIGELELTKIMSPPRDVSTVCVRANKSVGSIYTTSGDCRIEKDTEIKMRWYDAEPLIRQGILSIVETR